MSDLLNQASLVYIPSGYKEDTAYSVIPTDGSGDLTFTRASDGTRVNSQGLVERVPWNLLQYSEDFSNAAWNKYGAGTGSAASVTSGFADPNGGTNAWRLQCNLNGGTTSSDRSYLSQGGLSGTPFSASKSLWIKNNTASAVTIFVGINSVFDSVTIAASADWQRIKIEGGTINSEFRIGTMGGASLSNSVDIIIYGAQLNTGSTAKPYFPTTDRLNVPRLDYSGGCPSLLLEPQRTNLVTYSDVLQGASQWGYSNEMTITEVSETNPMGVNGCLKFTTTSANADHRAGQTSYGGSGYVAGDVICATAFVKANGYNFVKFGGNFGDEIAWFNLSNGTVASQQSNVLSAKIENFGNGWYRITNVYTFQNAIGNGLLYFNLTPAPTADSVYTGNGTSGCFAFGGQIEKNSSYPTSYIPTTSASVTRVADEASKTGISSLIGQTEGVLFVDFVYNSKSGTNRLSISDGTTNNWIFIGTPEDSANGVSRFYIKTNGSVAVDVGSSFYFTIGQRYKLAIAYKSGDWAVYGNGTLLYSGTSSIASVSSPLSVFNFFSITGVAGAAENINQTVLFKTRLTNAELASLTTL